MSLERFHQAQADFQAGYTTAVAELRAGAKRSHWIWHVFPQLDGLGRSSTARAYALRDLEEACAYLRDPLLRTRYEEITDVVAAQLAGGVSVETLMGGSTDAFKLVSSLTLFRAAAAQLGQHEPGIGCSRLEQLCDTVLNRTGAQEYGPCPFTLKICVGSSPT